MDPANDRKQTLATKNIAIEESKEISIEEKKRRAHDLKRLKMVYLIIDRRRGKLADEDVGEQRAGG